MIGRKLKFRRTIAQLGQMAKTRKKSHQRNSWNWRGHSYACNSLTNFQYDRKRKSGQSEDTCSKKFVKLVLVNLFSMGFSHLEALSIVRWYDRGKLDGISFELREKKKVINFCLWSSANQNHIFPSIRCRHYKVRNVLTNFLNVRKKNRNSNSVCGPLRIKTIITIRIRVSRSILFLNRRCFLTYFSVNSLQTS